MVLTSNVYWVFFEPIGVYARVLKCSINATTFADPSGLQNVRLSISVASTIARFMIQLPLRTNPVRVFPPQNTETIEHVDVVTTLVSSPQWVQLVQPVDVLGRTDFTTAGFFDGEIGTTWECMIPIGASESVSVSESGAYRVMSFDNG